MQASSFMTSLNVGSAKEKEKITAIWIPQEKELFR